MKNSSNDVDVHDCTVSTSHPPLPPPEPMTETRFHIITMQKGKFVEPSSSRSMEKYAYHDQQAMNISPDTTTTKPMESNLPAGVKVVSSPEQLVSQPLEIDIPGDIDLALLYSADVEWPKPKFKSKSKSSKLIIDLDDDEGPIADVKRLKLDSASSYQLTTSVVSTTKLFGATLKSTVTSTSGGKDTVQTLLDERDVETGLPLSRVWLRRWFHNGSKVAAKPEEVVPSVAAVAMVGRARDGSRPCQRRKKGAVTVWNT